MLFKKNHYSALLFPSKTIKFSYLKYIEPDGQTNEQSCNVTIGLTTDVKWLKHNQNTNLVKIHNFANGSKR